MKDTLTSQKVIIGIVVAMIIAIPFYAESNINEQQFTFAASANVTAPADNMTIGVDAGRNLDFGVVTAKNSVRKTVNISAPQQTLMTITATGNITPLLEFDGTHYFTGTKEVEITLNTTADDAGYYTGNVTMTAQTASNRAAQRWLAIKSRLY